MDKNNDGEVSKKEFLKPWQDKKTGEKAFQRLDVDGYGKITSSAPTSWVTSRPWTKDQDSYLTPDEYLGLWPGVPFLT